MKALALLFFIGIFVVIEWQERKSFKKSLPPPPKPDPQLSLFDDEKPMFKDQIHPLCEN